MHLAHVNPNDMWVDYSTETPFEISVTTVTTNLNEWMKQTDSQQCSIDNFDIFYFPVRVSSDPLFRAHLLSNNTLEDTIPVLFGVEPPFIVAVHSEDSVNTTQYLLNILSLAVGSSFPYFVQSNAAGALAFQGFAHGSYCYSSYHDSRFSNTKHVMRFANGLLGRIDSVSARMIMRLHSNPDDPVIIYVAADCMGDANTTEFGFWKADHLVIGLQTFDENTHDERLEPLDGLHALLATDEIEFSRTSGSSHRPHWVHDLAPHRGKGFLQSAPKKSLLLALAREIGTADEPDQVWADFLAWIENVFDHEHQIDGVGADPDPKHCQLQRYLEMVNFFTNKTRNHAQTSNWEFLDFQRDRMKQVLDEIDDPDKNEILEDIIETKARDPNAPIISGIFSNETVAKLWNDATPQSWFNSVAQANLCLETIKTMTPGEVYNCLYRALFDDLLDEINTESDWSTVCKDAIEAARADYNLDSLVNAWSTVKTVQFLKVMFPSEKPFIDRLVRNHYAYPSQWLLSSLESKYSVGQLQSHNDYLYRFCSDDKNMLIMHEEDSCWIAMSIPAPVN